MPFCPVNQRIPRLSNVAVLRFALPIEGGSRKPRKAVVPGSTRTIALSPPSVTHAAPSGPTMTPCGADPSPSGISVVPPVAGSSRPSLPVAWAVYQTVPSGAGATSCGCEPAGTVYSCTRGATAEVEAGRRSVAPLPWHDASDDAEAAVPERAEDDRLAFLEALTRRLGDDDPVRDEHGHFPRRGTGAEQPSRVAYLLSQTASCSDAIVFSSAGCTVARPKASRAVSSVRQYALDSTFPIGTPRRRTPRPIARASARPCDGEVPLRRAVRDDDGILIGLGEVRRGMPEDEHDPAGAERADEIRARRGGRARDEGHGQRGDDSCGERARGRHRLLLRRRPVHGSPSGTRPRLRSPDGGEHAGLLDGEG